VYKGYKILNTIHQPSYNRLTEIDIFQTLREFGPDSYRDWSSEFWNIPDC